MKTTASKKARRKYSGGFRREFLVFIFRFFAIWILAYALTLAAPEITSLLQRVVSRELAFVLRSAGYDFEARNIVFNLRTAHGLEKLYIIAECTGLYTTLIYLAIIGAFPARNRDRLAGILIGVPAIHLMNLARVVFISLVIYHRKDLFDFFHGYLWQVGFVVFMLILVFFWTAKIARPDREEKTGRVKDRKDPL